MLAASDQEAFIARIERMRRQAEGGAGPSSRHDGSSARRDDGAPAPGAAAAHGTAHPALMSPQPSAPSAARLGARAALFSSSPDTGARAKGSSGGSDDDAAEGGGGGARSGLSEAETKEMVRMQRRLGEVSAEVAVLEEGNQALLELARDAAATVGQLEEAASKAAAERQGAEAEAMTKRAEVAAAEREADDAEAACEQLEREIAELRDQTTAAERRAGAEESKVEREVTELRAAAAEREAELRKAISDAEAAEAEARSRSTALLAQADEVDELRREAGVLRAKLQSAGAYTLHRALAATVKDNREAMARLEAEAAAVAEEAARVSSSLQEAVRSRDAAHGRLRAAALARHRTSARAAAATRQAAFAAADAAAGRGHPPAHPPATPGADSEATGARSEPRRMELGGVDLAMLKELAPEEAEAWAARAHRELARTTEAPTAPAAGGGSAAGLGLTLREAQRQTQQEAAGAAPGGAVTERAAAPAGRPDQPTQGQQREALRQELDDVDSRLAPEAEEVAAELAALQREKAALAGAA